MDTDMPDEITTQTQIVVTFDDRPPSQDNGWPLYAETLENARAEYVADAIHWDLPGPHAVSFWQRTTTITNSPWKQLHQSAPKQ